MWMSQQRCPLSSVLTASPARTKNLHLETSSSQGPGLRGRSVAWGTEVAT